MLKLFFLGRKSSCIARSLFRGKNQMTLYDTLARLLDSGRMTPPDCGTISAVDPASVNRDRTVQLTDGSSVSFAEADGLAVEQMAQIVQETGVHPALLFGRDFPRVDSTGYSVIIDDPLCPEPSDDPRRGDPTIQVPYDSLNPSSADFSLSDELLSASLDNARADRLQTWIEGRQREEAVRRESFLAVCNRQMESLRGASPLQQKCRTCTYRNKDFDRRVPPEHSRDLKCAINPSYAMTGVGECSDFVADTTSTLSVADSLQTLPPGEIHVNLGQLLFNAIQAIPGVVSARVEMERFPDGWGYEIRVRTNDPRPLAYRIVPNEFNPVTVEMAIDFFREKILENR
jgi:hypothetical protein